jgi:hypothetical protein
MDFDTMRLHQMTHYRLVSSGIRLDHTQSKHFRRTRSIVNGIRPRHLVASALRESGDPGLDIAS